MVESCVKLSSLGHDTHTGCLTSTLTKRVNAPLANKSLESSESGGLMTAT